MKIRHLIGFVALLFATSGCGLLQANNDRDVLEGKLAKIDLDAPNVESRISASSKIKVSGRAFVHPGYDIVQFRGVIFRPDVQGDAKKLDFSPLENVRRGDFVDEYVFDQIFMLDNELEAGTYSVNIKLTVAHEEDGVTESVTVTPIYIE